MAVFVQNQIQILDTEGRCTLSQTSSDALRSLSEIFIA